MFASVDPFPGVDEEPASLVRYLYAAQNPHLWTDPSGEIIALNLMVSVGLNQKVDVQHNQRTLAQGAGITARARTIARGAATAFREARAIQNAIDTFARTRRTTAILNAMDPATGQIVRLVASGSRQLTAAQMHLARELGLVPVLRGGVHAEVQLLREAAARGLVPQMLVASRKFCTAGGCRRLLSEVADHVGRGLAVF